MVGRTAQRSGAVGVIDVHLFALPRARCVKDQSLRDCFSKKVRAKVSISAQVETSSRESADERRAEGAQKGRKRRRFATKWKGDGTKKRAILPLVSYLNNFYQSIIMNKPKYFLYARKSTEENDRQVMSIEAQLFELREFARKEKLEILEEFQESKSVKTPGRHIFEGMIEKITESNEGVGILSWSPDRLARNAVDAGQIVYLLDISKLVSLKFPNHLFEHTPQGKFTLSMAFVQSKY